MLACFWYIDSHDGAVRTNLGSVMPALYCMQILLKDAADELIMQVSMVTQVCVTCCSADLRNLSLRPNAWTPV